MAAKRSGDALEPIFGPPDSDSLAAYLRQIINRDKDRRATTREQYLITLRTHIEGTSFGETPISAIDPPMVEENWEHLDIGRGALRNVWVLLSKAFTKAVKRGVIPVSPLSTRS